MNAADEPREAVGSSSEPVSHARRPGGFLLAWDKRWERFYRRALPAYWMFLLIATHFPKLHIPGAVPRGDKLAHLIAYGILALFFWKFFESIQRPLSGRFVWNALAVITSYAVVDEVLQPIVGRRADFWDWVCDVTGAALMLAVLEWRRRAAGNTRVATRTSS